MKFFNLIHSDRINDLFVTRLRDRLAEAPTDSEGCRLILSTAGGTTAAGFSAVSVLRDSGLVLHTAANGVVKSIGIVIFSAGQHRLCNEIAAFHFHPVYVGDESCGERLSLPQLKEIRAHGLAGCSDKVLAACMELGLSSAPGMPDGDALNKRIASMELDSERIILAISKNTGIDSSRIAAAMAGSETWDAERAEELGLVNEIVASIQKAPDEQIRQV